MAKANHNTRSRRQVAIVQHCFPHYRRALFRRLCAQSPPAPAYTLYYGQPHEAARLKTVDPCEARESDENVSARFRRVRNRWLGRTFLWQSRVLEVASRSEFDTMIMEGNMYILSTWVGAILARWRGKRVLFWTHGFRRNEKGFQGWLRTRFYRLAHGLLLYGRHGRCICLEKGFSEDSLYVVFNSLDHDTQTRVRRSLTEQGRRELRSRLFSRPDLPVLLWVGRLHRSKRLDLLLRAVDRLRKAGREVNVLFVGDGAEQKPLAELSEALGLSDRVRFYGACYDEDTLGPLISAGDLCVAPGEVGLTAIHCLAYGTPVITHGTADEQKPESEAIIPGKTGDFFVQGDVQDLTSTVAHWLDAAPSRQRAREACCEVIEKYYHPGFGIAVVNAAVQGIPAGHVLPQDLAEQRRTA